MIQRGLQQGIGARPDLVQYGDYLFCASSFLPQAGLRAVGPVAPVHVALRQDRSDHALFGVLMDSVQVVQNLDAAGAHCPLEL